MNELDEAIELLRQNYEKAQGEYWITHPIAWALYQTWKVYDAERREMGGRKVKK